MKRVSSYVRVVASFAAIGVLSACASMRAAQHPAEPVSPPPPESTEPPPPTPAPAAESEGTSTPPAETSSSTPTCSCAETKAKPKPRPKPRPVHKEAPPQLPTAPAVAETPSGGVVDAQVKPLPVPVTSILGKKVKGAKGEDLGRVVDVLADASGRVRVAIIDFGGFLGVGNHRIAVDWPLLRFNPEDRDQSLLLSLSREKLAAAPEYKEVPQPQTLMEPAVPAPAPASLPEESKK
jgi:hypothetical protein